MKRLLTWAFAVALGAGVPALAANHPHGGGGHPAAHSGAGMHVSRPSAHFSRHRAAMHRAVHHSAHHPVRHTARHVARRTAHHAVHHAVRHTVRHASHATVAHQKGRFANVRRSVRAMRRFHAGAYRRPAGWYAHHWVIGERLPRLWFGRDYWISDWAIYGLWAPVDGLVWVRVGPDAVLVDPSGGSVVGIEYGLFF